MANLLKIPGMLDPHTHLRDLDWSHKATFYSETAAAVAGGYTAVFDMPNTPPETISSSALQTKLNAFGKQAVCDYGVYFGAAQQDNTSQYADVVSKTCGLKMFCNATTGNLLIENQADREKHFTAWSDTRLIVVHAEEETVQDILALVRKYRKRTHFLHISTQREIAYLRAAKEEGLPITIGVCPHHLFLTEEDVPALGGYGIMKPSLKTRADVDALWQAIRGGVVDVVESDHAPHTIAEKESDKPPFGVPGLETTLPLLLTAASEGRISIKQVIQLVAENPRRIWGVPCPPETYTLVDLDEIHMIDRWRLQTLCGWSPFVGMRAKGKVLETWIRGTQVFDGENICVEPGFGQNCFG